MNVLKVFLNCLFVSRVRLMLCLSPDGHVRICGVPHGCDPYPSMNSLAGAYFRGRDLNSVNTELKQDCSTSLTLPQAI